MDRGETVRITNHGKPRARIVPDAGFMTSSEFARVFEDYKAGAADKAAADAVAGCIAQLDAEEGDALAH